MKHELISKALDWLAFGATQFNNNLPTNPQQPQFKIERTETGHFYTASGLCYYADLTNGMVYRIRKDWQPKDWKCYTLLYEKGVASGKFRIDKPLVQDFVQVLDETWEYVELQSPGYDYGKNYSHDVFQWPELTNGITVNPDISEEYKDSVKQYYLDFVDQSVEILSAAKEIAIQEMCGIPLGLAYIFNRYKDDQGYFWSDFDQFTWTRTGTDVLNDALVYLVRTLGFARYCGVLDWQRTVEVISYGREKWSTI